MEGGWEVRPCLGRVKFSEMVPDIIGRETPYYASEVDSGRTAPLSGSSPEPAEGQMGMDWLRHGQRQILKWAESSAADGR